MKELWATWAVEGKEEISKRIGRLGKLELWCGGAPPAARSGPELGGCRLSDWPLSLGLSTSLTFLRSVSGLFALVLQVGEK